MKTPPQVNQTLYSLNVGNAARNCKQVLSPVIVRKVGRKYFECSSQEYPGNTVSYHLDDWRENTQFCVNSKLYADPREWEEENEARGLHARLHKAFESYVPNMPLDKLRKMVQILES